MAAVDARSRDRLENLNNTIERRKQSEIADIIHILDDLDANIRKELDERSKRDDIRREKLSFVLSV